MREPGDIVRIRRQRGKFKLIRTVKAKSGLEGWLMLGPNGKLRYYMEKDIK